VKLTRMSKSTTNINKQNPIKHNTFGAMPCGTCSESSTVVNSQKIVTGKPPSQLLRESVLCTSMNQTGLIFDYSRYPTILRLPNFINPEPMHRLDVHVIRIERSGAHEWFVGQVLSGKHWYVASMHR
jgi:hypothetical protein